MQIPNKLLFVATFADGTQIFQNAEDEGTVEGRNCYFDVLQKQLDVPPICFVLLGGGYPTFGVDLRDGHFEVNGTAFFQHEEPLSDFRLVWARIVNQHRTFKVLNGEPVGEPEDRGELAGYIIGWETEYNGETIKRVIKI